jgi:hypothetical protein
MGDRAEHASGGPTHVMELGARKRAREEAAGAPAGVDTPSFLMGARSGQLLAPSLLLRAPPGGGGSYDGGRGVMLAGSGQGCLHGGALLPLPPLRLQPYAPPTRYYPLQCAVSVLPAPAPHQHAGAEGEEAADTEREAVCALAMLGMGGGGGASVPAPTPPAAAGTRLPAPRRKRAGSDVAPRENRLLPESALAVLRAWLWAPENVGFPYPRGARLRVCLLVCARS